MYRSVIIPGILLRKKAMKGVNYYQYLKLHPKDGPGGWGGGGINRLI